MTNEITGRLEAWCPDNIYGRILWGTLYGDSKGRWKDGTRIHTSDIMTPKEEWKEGVVIQTRNSTYLLGKPIVDGVVK